MRIQVLVNFPSRLIFTFAISVLLMSNVYLISNVCVRIKGLEMLVFWKILRTYLMAHVDLFPWIGK